ncbi:MAG: histidine phosphatase family protein [Ktedonobacteraceae bacterium]|nr:histidine phosphatase family protein [Ktedonobacteraceae bacterium]
MQKNREPAEQKFRRLWLVRHGATLWNSEQRFCGHSDIGLSAEGQEQAGWLAQSLQGHSISTIYTSDLLRARQTAEMIATPSTRIEVSAAWREIAFGAWEGLTYEQITQQFPVHLDFFSHPLSTAPPDGETLHALMQRVQNAFLELARAEYSSAEGDIVLVSHGGPLRVLLSIVLAMPLEEQWRLRLAPGSLSAIDFLPIIDDTMPVATLALFNMQRPARL